MNAKLCDRCHELYRIYHKVVNHPNRTTVVTVNGIELMDDDSGVGKIDLCPKCLEDFKFFMGIGGKRLDKE